MFKNFFYIVLLLGFFIPINIVIAQEPPPEYNDWIRKFDGIPIHASLHWHWMLSNAEAVYKMRQAGVDVITTDIGITQGVLIDPEDQIYRIDTTGFNLMPIRSRSQSTSVMNWIQHYTDAKYSVWEAEGNDNYDANLEHDDLKTEVIPNGDSTSVRRIGTIANSVDTLIKGPYYCQDVKYLASQNGTLLKVEYTANFRLKLEENPNYPPPIDDNPEDTICVIQVTQSSVAVENSVWFLDCTDVIKERGITLGEFNQLNQFQDFRLDPNNTYDYTLETNYCDSATIFLPEQHTFLSYLGMEELPPGPRWIREYIQFKVIWKGKSNTQGKPAYLLSVDKVTVSDERGDLLVNTSIPEGQILDQLETLSPDHDDLVSGWLGIDEPVSIDIFEPIRIVTEILDNNSQRKRPLWIAMMGHWDGAWNNSSPNNFGAMRLSPWVEFKKRVGRGNIIQNAYMFDAPCYPGNPYSACDTGEDYRSINIWRTAELMYKQAYELDPFYGVSLQCGEIHNTQANERNVHRHEVLYNANLALMYGAKFFSLFTYFAQRNTEQCESGLTCRGIVDYYPDIYHPIYTDKYDMMRDTLSPRLKGLFGKTLKA